MKQHQIAIKIVSFIHDHDSRGCGRVGVTDPLFIANKFKVSLLCVHKAWWPLTSSIAANKNIHKKHCLQWKWKLPPRVKRRSTECNRIMRHKETITQIKTHDKCEVKVFVCLFYFFIISNVGGNMTVYVVCVCVCGLWHIDDNNYGTPTSNFQTYDSSTMRPQKQRRRPTLNVRRIKVQPLRGKNTNDLVYIAGQFLMS